MGQAQDRLARALASVGRVTTGVLTVPRRSHLLCTPYHALYEAAYRALGGVMDEAPFRPGKWDIEFEGIAVELDEQLHFNRYRSITLRSPTYDDLPAFPDHIYLTYCQEHEAECLKAGAYGGKWSNSSCERQFGPGGTPGDIGGRGAPRWRQRALYDLAKDMAPLVANVRMARVSIYDLLVVAGHEVLVRNELAQPTPEVLESLVLLIRERASGD